MLGHHISDREYPGYTKVQWLGGTLGAVLTDPLPPPSRTRYQASSGSTAMSFLLSSELVLWDWLVASRAPAPAFRGNPQQRRADGTTPHYL
jgi:hypothetical protein